MESSRNEERFGFVVAAIVVYFVACLILTYTVAEPYPAIMAPEFRLPKEAGLPERTVSVVEVHRVDQVGGRSMRRPLHTDSLFPRVPPHLQAALLASGGVTRLLATDAWRPAPAKPRPSAGLKGWLVGVTARVAPAITRSRYHEWSRADTLAASEWMLASAYDRRATDADTLVFCRRDRRYRMQGAYELLDDRVIRCRAWVRTGPAASLPGDP
ncbi:MAG: hypothetical protein ACREMH_11525 [Gemmatimonadales bacterium]